MPWAFATVWAELAYPAAQILYFPSTELRSSFMAVSGTAMTANSSACQKLDRNSGGKKLKPIVRVTRRLQQN